MIYFISDLHLNHTNIIKYCNRPFKTVEEMNDTLIKNWNNVVTENDIVYILGDLTLGGINIVNNTLEKLNGTKYIVLGNHDCRWLKKAKELKGATIIGGREPVKLIYNHCGKNLKLLLTHWPKKLNEVEPVDYIVYGHIHNNEDDPYWPYQQTHKKVLNAAVEINNYRPVTFNDLIENNNKIKKVK